MAREGKTAAKMGSECKSFQLPDETRSFEKGQLELIRVGGRVVGRLTLASGWQWSKHVRPIALTEWCEVPHFQYQLSGRLHVKTADGKDFETKAGDVIALLSGHDAWVVGDEAVVLVDWSGAGTYATQEAAKTTVGPKDSRGARATVSEGPALGERRVSERRR